MPYYEIPQNPGNFSINNPSNLINSKLQLFQSTISVPAISSIYNNSSGVTYNATDLLNGYITRKGITGNVTDTFDTATNIINVLRARYTSITNLSFVSTGPAILPLGTIFKCKLYNDVPSPTGVNNYNLSFYSSLDLSVRIGGNTPQIVGGATALLEIVIQDQAALGAGHIDQVFICISRCAAAISVEGCIPPTAEPITVGGIVYIPDPYEGLYNFYYNITWTAFPYATYYGYTTNYTGGYAFVETGTNEVVLYTDTVSIDPFDVTVTGYDDCGFASSTGTAYPCFLAGSLIAMADGTFKVIEEVEIGDLIIGAFGEVNKVLALHRPLLKDAKMMKINNEHHSTSHHPHISLDKKFYCGSPEIVSKCTYGLEHEVIGENGQKEMKQLLGLKPERIHKLETGINLKTIEGSRQVTTLKEYSLPPDTQLYNLVVSGSHTYHVDGYAVTGWPREDDFDYDTWTSKL